MKGVVPCILAALAHENRQSVVCGAELPSVNLRHTNVFDRNRTKTSFLKAPEAAIVFRVPLAFPLENADGWNGRCTENAPLQLFHGITDTSATLEFSGDAVLNEMNLGWIHFFTAQKWAADGSSS
jgi:hypothetical protein